MRGGGSDYSDRDMAVQGQSLSCVSLDGLLPQPTDVMEPWAFWGFLLTKCLPPLPTGVASVVVSFFLSMYYNVINAWAFWYLFHSFQVCGLSMAQFGPTVAAEGHGGSCIGAGCCMAPLSAGNGEVEGCQKL